MLGAVQDSKSPQTVNFIMIEKKKLGSKDRSSDNYYITVEHITNMDDL